MSYTSLFHTQQSPFSEALTYLPYMLTFEFSRYALAAIVVFALTRLAFAGSLTGRKIRAHFPETAQLTREFLASIRTVAIFSLSGVASIVGGRYGLQRNYEDPAALGWLWFWASVAILIVLHDAWFYWTHRLIHHPKLFKRWHGLHHKSRNPSPFAAYSFDAAEACVNAAFLPLALVVLPVSEPAIFLFLGHMIVRNVIGHSGYELYPARRNGRPLVDWMTTVTHHDLHHAQAGWNYGLYFTWWDRWMGTEHPQYAEKFAQAVRIPLDGSAVKALAPRTTLVTSGSAGGLAQSRYDRDLRPDGRQGRSVG
ncbi:MAG: sterol desaturase family protein [Parvularculaceae bacterium]